MRSSEGHGTLEGLVCREISGEMWDFAQVGSGQAAGRVHGCVTWKSWTEKGLEGRIPSSASVALLVVVNRVQPLEADQST